jgi:hypothetical protein
MKKPMKFKRYESGGDVADKEAGLKASKDEDVGFFQRLRMGNIDDPSSEAYKRFGAGRGRSERNPVHESVSVSGSEPIVRPSMRPRPIERALSDDMYSDYGNIKGGMGTGTGEAGSSYYVGKNRPSDFPNIPPMAESTSSPSKPSASKPAKPAKPSEPKVTDTGDESSRLLTRYKKPPLRQETMDERAKRFIEKREAAKREKEANPARGRGGVPYQKGGMVSSASKRADGIATKGKTRGKIC